MWHQSVNCNFMKPREYFLCKENKINDCIPHFHLYCFSCGRAFTTVHDASAWRRKPWSRSSVMTLNTCLVFNVITACVQRHHAGSGSETRETVEMKIWNTIVIFVFFAQKVFSWLRKITVDRLMSHGLLCRSSWYFSGKDPCRLWEGQRAPRYHQTYLKLCSEDEWRSYGFGTTSGWVINDRILIFGWTNPLNNN